MNYKEVRCNYCGGKFLRSSGRINEAKKFGWKQYCSSNCKHTAHLTGTEFPCQTCGKTVRRTPKETGASKTRRFFCDTSCAAIFNNHLRIRHKKPLKACSAENCNSIVKDRHSRYCSRKCGATPRRRTLESIREEVLSSIKKFNETNGRIPVKKELNAQYRKARTVFGTWNKAIKAAGYKPNPVMFANKYIAKDGHKCDSLAEKIIDEWLYSKGIHHDRSVPYPEDYKLTCDFVINKTFIEFFGLKGEVKRYDRLVTLKRRLSKKYKLKLIELKPAHLFPKNKLDEVLGSII